MVRPPGSAVPSYDLDLDRKAQAYAYSPSYQESGKVSPLFSMDSGLEAFSLNPTHGSVSALTFQSTEFANYVNQRFLSY
jgi:hypothetical protein